MKQSFTLIPRVRVNYKLRHIIKAFFISERDNTFSSRIKTILCNYFETDNIILTSSGRSSLYLILKSLPQTKVIIPAYTCKVVEEAAKLAGKEIKYAKTSNNDFNISELPEVDNNSIVIATHQYGIPCNIEYIADVCRRNKAILVEDCAASFGTSVNGKLTGTFGDYSFFSFDSSKLINTPSKGGFIIAQNSELYNRINLSNLFPSSFTYKLKHLIRGALYCVIKNSFIYRVFHYLTMGRNGKMHIDESNKDDFKLSDFYTHGFYEWQAYITYPQLKILDKIIEKRGYIYHYYHERLNNSLIKKPPYNPHSTCIRYTLQVENQKAFYEYCLKKGVDMGFSFNHISSPTCYTEEHMIANEILNIPFYFDLSQKEMEKVVNVINSYR